MTDTSSETLLDAVCEADGYYLRCSNGHSSLPPRRVCPTCGARRLTEAPLADVGTLQTYTVVHVSPPSFRPETPYVTGIASFGDVRVTGVVTDVDPDDVTVGMTVRLGCLENGDDRYLALSPATGGPNAE